MTSAMPVITNGKQYVLVSNRFYKGLMLRANHEQKEIHVVKIGACRRISMHFEQRPWLNFSLIHIVGHVYE